MKNNVDPQLHTITITGIDPKTKKLILSDGGQTDVNPGDTVMWLIGKDSGVASITAIKENRGSTDLFSSGEPRQVANTTSWQGVIDLNVRECSYEAYTISWKAVNGEENHQDDPKIQVNS